MTANERAVRETVRQLEKACNLFLCSRYNDSTSDKALSKQLQNIIALGDKLKTQADNL